MENAEDKKKRDSDEDLMLVLKDLRTAMQLIADTMSRHDDDIEKKVDTARRMERYRMAAFFFGLPCAILGIYVICALLIQAIR